MAIAARYELAGDDITAMVMRVAAHNDYTDWEPVPKPPLGKVTKLEEECDGPLVQVGFWMGNDRCFPA
ncbi:MAG: hypothetical protein KJ709_04245 [Nanoarchaeota archaeon]|nr:hypothetical protein [Nanoarchaeota archaeon]